MGSKPIRTAIFPYTIARFPCIILYMNEPLNPATKLPSEGRAAFLTQVSLAQGVSASHLARLLWDAKKAKASLIIDTPHDQIIYGPDLELTPHEIAMAEDRAIAADEVMAKGKEPYGPVSYADPGYQADKKKRYPIDTEEHIRAALSYFKQDKNSSQYTYSQRAKILARIIRAWKRVIDPKGPPSEQNK